MEQAKSLGKNFKIVQWAIAMFLSGLAVQYLYFAIVSATEDEVAVRWMNIISQLLGMTSMGLAALEMSLSYG